MSLQAPPPVASSPVQLIARDLRNEWRTPVPYPPGDTNFDLKRAGIVDSHRGSEGGYRLARPPDALPLADIIRAVEGPLAQVGDARPEDLHYAGAAEPLSEVWIAVRANLRAVLELVTVADVTDGSLPKNVRDLVRDPEAWISH